MNDEGLDKEATGGSPRQAQLAELLVLRYLSRKKWFRRMTRRPGG